MRENESLRESERDIIPDLRLRQGGEGIQAKLVRTPVGSGVDCCAGRWQRRLEHYFFRPQPLSLFPLRYRRELSFSFFLFASTGLPATVTLSP